ncbi:MAG: SMC-Scp complex subunit ScpB [Pseudomonadota bacterium]|nr:SMC-Scp complex subunit ScpB [Pseudomonadota bacterium]
MPSALLENVVEGALLAAGEPLSLDRLLNLFQIDDAVDKSQLRAALTALEARYEPTGLMLKEVASGWRIQVREQLAPWVSRLWDERPARYTRALLETLALIAYQQPLTRSDIEQVRGVAVSSNIVKTLLERDWIRIVGHRDVPGRPALYGTTRTFLDYFNLKSLDALPPLAEIRDLEQLSKSLGLPLEESNEEAVPKAVALEAVLGIEDPGAFEREVGAAEDAGDAEETPRS